jgi:hypothetical protein
MPARQTAETARRAEAPNRGGESGSRLATAWRSARSSLRGAGQGTQLGLCVKRGQVSGHGPRPAQSVEQLMLGDVCRRGSEGSLCAKRTDCGVADRLAGRRWPLRDLSRFQASGDGAAFRHSATSAAPPLGARLQANSSVSFHAAETYFSDGSGRSAGAPCDRFPPSTVSIAWCDRSDATKSSVRNCRQSFR